MDLKHLDEPHPIEFISRSDNHKKERIGISVFHQAMDLHEGFQELEEFEESYWMDLKRKNRAKQRMDKQANVIFEKRKNSLKKNMRKRKQKNVNLNPNIDTRNQKFSNEKYG